MSEPVVYLSTWRIKEGRIADYRRFFAEAVKALRGPDRDVLAFYAFANADGTEITNVHVYPDAETLDRHMAILAEQMGILPATLRSVLEFMEPLGVQVYGAPSGQAASMDQGMKDSGVPFTGKEEFVGGFSLADRGNA